MLARVLLGAFERCAVDADRELDLVHAVPNNALLHGIWRGRW